MYHFMPVEGARYGGIFEIWRWTEGYSRYVQTKTQDSKCTWVNAYRILIYSFCSFFHALFNEINGFYQKSTLINAHLCNQTLKTIIINNNPQMNARFFWISFPRLRATNIQNSHMWKIVIYLVFYRKRRLFRISLQISAIPSKGNRKPSS